MFYIWGPHEPKILPQPLFFILTHVSVTRVSSLRDFFHAGCKDGMFSKPFHIQHVSAACTHEDHALSQPASLLSLETLLCWIWCICCRGKA